MIRGNMIKRHKDCEIPHGNTIIWRYMGIDQFLQLLLYNNLFFSNITNLTDGYEGLLPRKTVNEKRELIQSRFTNQRDLNTILTNEITGASLSSNVITLPAGTFFISASSPTNRGGTNRAHLLNTVAGSPILLGTSENTQTGDTTPTRSFINGRFTIGSSTTFRIRHYTTAAKSDNGLGIQANDSRTEVYTDVLIWKVS